MTIEVVMFKEEKSASNMRIMANEIVNKVTLLKDEQHFKELNVTR